MKITVVGSGYVGLSNAALLAQHNEVAALEIMEVKVELINKKITNRRQRNWRIFINKSIEFNCDNG